RAMHVRVGPDREGRIAHDAPHLDDDLLLAARSVPVLLADLRAGEEVDDVLQPDNALQVPALVDDRHRAFGERPYDLHRVLDGVVRIHLAEDFAKRVFPSPGHEGSGHEVAHPQVLDLVPLHEEPAGERAIAAWRIRKVRPLPSEPIAAPDLSGAARELSEPIL